VMTMMTASAIARGTSHEADPNRANVGPQSLEIREMSRPATRVRVCRPHRCLTVMSMSISILVVEDYSELRDAVRDLLEDEGYEVHCASDPDEAMALLKRLPRPCILLWDALTSRHSLSMVDQATLNGVHVATLPVTLASIGPVGSLRRMAKRLTSTDAILSIVREHCPLEATGSS
jgi:two-component system, OmpR family, response regulator CpxR